MLTLARSWTLEVVMASWRKSHDMSDKSCCRGLSHRRCLQWYTEAATKQFASEGLREERGRTARNSVGDRA